jgi:hypothetical protein
MKLSHIASNINGTPTLMHFLHFKHVLINIREIVSVRFNDSTDYKSVGINTTDGIHHLISDEQDIQGLKEFFQVK